MPSKGFTLSSLILLFLSIVSCDEKETMFVSLPSSQTNIDFTNEPVKKKLFSILYYLYYYNGGGVAAGDINNDGLPDLYFSSNSNGGNKLYLNKGNFEFEDITASAGVAGTSDWSTGVTMTDVNGDGLMDIYVCAIANAHGLEGRNQLFINNGDSTFTESAKKYGLDFSGFSTQAAFFDYDHDGDLDCYLLNQSQHPHQNIVDTSNRRKFDEDEGDRFYRNDLVIAGITTTNEKFTDVSKETGIYQSNLGYGLGIAVADFNNDGWEDVYVGNDFHENDYYYLNNHDGTFTESGADHFGHYSRFSMGNDAADYNNDGHIDVVTVDMLPPDEKILKTYGSDENADIFKFKLQSNGFQYQCSRNCLQRNNGDGKSFSDIALISGTSATDWSWSPLFADFDNDGIKDLFVSSGIVKRPVDLDYIRFVSDLYNKKNYNRTDKYDEQALSQMPDGSSKPFLYKGDGKLGFKDVSDDWGTGNMQGYFNGAAYADFDNDGAVDLAISQIGKKALILKNNTKNKNSITFSFRGYNANRKGVGAKVYVYQGGTMQYQQLMLTRGFQSSSEERLHFGFAENKPIDSVIVIWGDERGEVLKNVPINKPLTLWQRNVFSGRFDYGKYFPSQAPVLNEMSDVALFRHQENRFNDFNEQGLIPHEQSTRGPKIATADVNGDGLGDFYVCGAKGQPGTLMIQQSSGSFISSDTAAFSADRNAEDVDAKFFDANGDGAPDLYVVSGGNEYTGERPALLDRLYINNGKGKFTKATDALPLLYANKSCVAIADIDKDGDSDIFAGTLADAKAYGVPQTSYLLLNDGKGKFSVAAQDVMALDKLGMVSSAGFIDVNKDGWPDLVVAGEWMPLTIFTNNNGKFQKSTLPASTGLWQTIFIDDINKDGNNDILVGNWGWNTKYWSGKNGPLKLYVDDFDRNGRTDQLLSYTFKGKEYPFLAKDEVERTLPLLKKHYLKYADYAGVVMKDVFYGWVDTIKPLQAERLGSVVCYGDGRGGFVIKDLPAGLQLAPIFSFQKMHGTDNAYISGGNFLDVIPYEGQYDAQPLAIFSAEKDSISVYPPNKVPVIKGQVRDLKWINENTLLVAANNDSLRCFKLNIQK
ncbi:MAG: VCBS repeat-containing protein [Chitinophagaceae bacterium]|nr:VCBS repeat-containing protein [Chitinophagaceae bacterium]